MILRQSIIAISVLAVVLLAGSALWAQDGCNSIHISNNCPTSMTGGQLYIVNFTMQNNGTSTWTDGTGSTDWNFGPWDAPPGPNVGWSARADVGGPIAPTEQKTFTLNVTAPTTSGTYDTTWGMVHEAVHWFGEIVHVIITVSPGPPMVYAEDTYETYADQQLQICTGHPMGPYGFTPGGGSYNNNQIVVQSASGGYDGSSKSVKFENIPIETLDSQVMWNFNSSFKTNPGESGYGNGTAMLQFRVKSLTPTPVGDNFWYMTMRGWQGVAEQSYGFVQGSDTTLNFFSSAGGVKTTLEGSAGFDGNWHLVRMICDTQLNKTYWYFDGNFICQGTHDGGGSTENRVRDIEFWQLARSTSDTMQVLVDNVLLGQHPLPKNTITSPIPNDVFGTLTPTIAWTRTWSAADVQATQVRVVKDTGDPNSGTLVWDSGDVAGANTSQVTGELPNSTTLWVFERDKLVGGSYQPWSNGVQFSCSVTIPSPPTVTAPSGTIANAKPLVTFTGEGHTRVQVKITTDSGGSNIVYDSTELVSTAFSHPVADLLDEGAYYAFASIGIATGMSAYSSGLAFTVDRDLAFTDVMHMDEDNILTIDDPYPNDRFGHIFMPNQYQDGEGTSTTVYVTDPVCGNVGLFWNDRGASRSIRQHKLGSDIEVGNLNLDKGITLMWAVAVLVEGGADAGGSSWRMATNLLMDKAPSGESYFIAIRTLPTGVGLITETTYGNEAFGTGWTHHWSGWSESTDYRILRLTGRNQIAGDYTSTVWKLYVNEVASPVLTVNGCLVASIMEPDPNERAGGFQTDAYGIGHGSAGSTGDIVFDWTAVNGSGDYAPGEWTPFGGGGGGAFSGIGAAKAAGTEAAPVSIVWTGAGMGVITKVVTHEELQGDPPAPVTVQDGFFAQDVAVNNAVSGVFVATSDTKEGAVIEGAALTALSGVMVERSVVGAEQTIGGRAIVNPTFTVQGSAVYPASAMTQKSLAGVCIDQNLGGSLDTMGMYVKVFGKVTLASFTGGGLPYFYVDDGSGAIDDREPAAGMRVVLPIDAEVIPTVGDYVMVEGWSAYEIATGGAYTNVRTLVYPTVTLLATGLP